MSKSSRHERQLKFLKLLQEREGGSVTRQDICDATGWKPTGAPKISLAKHVLDDVLTRQPDGSYAVRGASDLTEAQFLRMHEKEGVLSWSSRQS